MPTAFPSNSPDIAVIGGGIVGLWTAYYAAQAGQSVSLIESGTLASGASGGVLGALMPHQPTGWNAKKQFQLDGLLTLPREIEQLAAQTGVDCGYFRCGRVMPIRHPEKRRQSQDWAAASRENWTSPHLWTVEDENPASGWLADGAGTQGYNSDTLSARINPRKLASALIAALKTFSNVSIVENTNVRHIAADGAVSLDDASHLTPGCLVIAAGAGSFPLLEPLMGMIAGVAVKGQAALLKPTMPISHASPILYDAGTYVIAHEDGTVAVGSTSEREYADPHTTDEKLENIIEAAQMLCPALENAKIVERWAGLRPRANSRDPLIGALPCNRRIIAATGGFKITLGIAHVMARCAITVAHDGSNDIVPAPFRPETLVSGLKPR